MIGMLVVWLPLLMGVGAWFEGSGAENAIFRDFQQFCLIPSQSRPTSLSQQDYESRNNAESSMIHIISAATPNIFTYASLALAVNKEYASFRGYNFTFIQEDKTSQGFYNKYDEDSRWNKVKYLWEAIETYGDLSTQKRLRRQEYLVWLDADLIVTNFQFDIATLVEEHPEVDIWMSKDKIDAPFVGNTGCIIVKVSSWSKQFLELWWNAYDRKKCCDQNALTWLYDRQLPSDIQSKLEFLPSFTLNTEFPAYLGPHRFENMLHLAGMNTIYRYDIFATAYDNVRQWKTHVAASSEESDCSLPRHLGVDYRFLQSRIVQLDYQRLCALQRLQHNIESLSIASQRDQIHDITNSMKKLEVLRNWLNDVTKNDDDEQVIVQQWLSDNNEEQFQQLKQERAILAKNISTTVFEVHLGIRHYIYQLVLEQNASVSSCSNILSYSSVSGSGSENNRQIFAALNACRQLLLLYQNAITSTFELILSRDPYPQPDRAVHMLNEEIGLLFKDVTRHVPPELKGILARFAYYRFKQYQLLADVFTQQMQKLETDLLLETHTPAKKHALQQQSSLVTGKCIEHLSTAAHCWQELVSTYAYYGTDYVTADPHKEYVDLAIRLGILLCRDGQHRAGIDVLDDARAKQDAMTRGYDTLRIATESIMRQGRTTLGEIYVNMVLCAVDWESTIQLRSYSSESFAGIALLKREWMYLGREILEREHAQASLAYVQLMEIVVQSEERSDSRSWSITKEGTGDNSQLLDESSQVANNAGTKKFRRKRKKLEAY